MLEEFENQARRWKLNLTRASAGESVIYIDCETQLSWVVWQTAWMKALTKVPANV